MKAAQTVLVEVDDLNGHKIPVGLDAIAGTAVPVQHPETRTAFALRVLSIETHEDDWHPAVEEIAQAAASISWTGTHRDFGQAAAEALDRSDLRNSRPDRGELVRAAGFIVAAIAKIDAQAPVEVRKDDLRRVLDSIDDASWKGVDDAVRRLQDALGGS